MSRGVLEQELHKVVHLERQPKLASDLLTKPRLKLFSLVERLLNRKIQGKVLDIGAGNGYAGGWLALNRCVAVTALECTDEAVTITIPATKAILGIEDELRPELGDFNELGSYEKTFDYVVSFGVLHHAEDLYAATKSVYGCLKPGGILIANEPYVSDDKQNDAFRQVYNSKELFAGREIRHGDRNDIFHRHCEYLTALYFSNFEILKTRDVTSLVEGKLHLLRRIKQRIKYHVLSEQDKGVPSNFSLFRNVSLDPRSRLYVCQRPLLESEDVPHIWHTMRETT